MYYRNVLNIMIGAFIVGFIGFVGLGIYARLKNPDLVEISTYIGFLPVAVFIVGGTVFFVVDFIKGP